MVRRIRPLGVTGWAARTAIAVGVFVAVAACGSVVAGGRSVAAGRAGATPVPGGQASAGVALCMGVPRLTSVAVSRTTSPRAFEPSQVLPRGIAIRDRLRARELATALCGLPKAPGGSVNCAVQFVGSWRLVFAAGERSFAPVTVQVGGCRVVRGLGPARMVPSLAFWRAFGKDLGLRFPQGPSQPGGVNR